MFNGTVITKEGQSVLAYCLANELPIKFTYMKIGDGVLSTETEEELSDLISEQLAVLIEHKSCSNGIYMLRAVFTNQSLSQGFYIRECGVFVNNPETNKDVLFAYDNAGAGEDVDYFAPGNGKVILKEVFETFVSIGNDANVTLVINPSLIYVTEEEFDALKDEVSKKIKNAGNFSYGIEYKQNDFFEYDGCKYLVENSFTAGSVPDFSKVYILSRKGKYDHFRIDLDFNVSLNPCKGNGITYHGGCENFTQEDWVQWIGYKPCILVVNGGTQGIVETYLDPNNYSKNINGETVDITSVPSSCHRSVMIKIPRIGIVSNFNPYERKGSIRITNDMNAPGYSYGAFNCGCRKSERFFVGAYPAYCENSKLYSLSGKVQTTDKSLSQYRACANAVGMNYGILDHIKLSLFHNLYIIQNGKIDGRMLSAPSEDYRTTGTLNTSGLNLNSVGTTARKVLGMEGNGVAEAIDGIYLDSNGYLKICKDGFFNDTYSNYIYNGTPYLLSNGYMGSMVSLSEDVGILAYTSSGTSDNYFRCHVAKKNTNKIEQAMASNIFDTEFALDATTARTLTARLCFMN